MEEFIRARSPEQKEVRMEEIKEAAAALYHKVPYSNITLTLIADQLSWTRANLYRYVKTKEDIFLELIEDSMMRYYEALGEVVTATKGSPVAEVAEKWADVCVDNIDYLRYSDVLTSIVADNVTPERVARFTDASYRCSENMSRRLAERFDCAPSHAQELLIAVFFHGVGRTGLVHSEEVMNSVLDDARFRFRDFRESMRVFILTHLNGVPSQA